jgi:hypothetical protein
LLSVQATAGGSTPLFTIASSTNGAATSTLMTVLANGNVGIGVTNPTDVQGILQSLDVNGNIRAGGSVYTYNKFAANAHGGNINPDIGNTGTVGIYAGDSGNIYMSGNVGIGTTSPGALLSVAGAGGGNQTSPLFMISSSTAAYATSTAFIIDKNGLVGIGTSSPYQTLSVNGSLALTGGFYDTTASPGTNNYILRSTGTSTLWVSTSSRNIAFRFSRPDADLSELGLDSNFNLNSNSGRERRDRDEYAWRCTFSCWCCWWNDSVIYNFFFHCDLCNFNCFCS